MNYSSFRIRAFALIKQKPFRLRSFLLASNHAREWNVKGPKLFKYLGGTLLATWPLVLLGSRTIVTAFDHKFDILASHVMPLTSKISSTLKILATYELRKVLSFADVVSCLDHSSLKPSSTYDRRSVRFPFCDI